MFQVEIQVQDPFLKKKKKRNIRNVPKRKKIILTLPILTTLAFQVQDLLLKKKKERNVRNVPKTKK